MAKVTVIDSPNSRCYTHANELDGLLACLAALFLGVPVDHPHLEYGRELIIPLAADVEPWSLPGRLTFRVRMSKRR